MDNQRTPAFAFCPGNISFWKSQASRRGEEEEPEAKPLIGCLRFSPLSVSGPTWMRWGTRYSRLTEEREGGEGWEGGWQRGLRLVLACVCEDLGLEGGAGLVALRRCTQNFHRVVLARFYLGWVNPGEVLPEPQPHVRASIASLGLLGWVARGLQDLHSLEGSEGSLLRPQSPFFSCAEAWRGTICFCCSCCCCFGFPLLLVGGRTVVFRICSWQA